MENSGMGFTPLAEQYHCRLTRCRALEAKNSFLRQRMVQLRGLNDPCVRAVVPILNAQLRELHERIRQENNRLATSALALDNEIAKLRDERLALILRCRYLELMPWEQISEITGLGVRWLMRLNKKAILELG